MSSDESSSGENKSKKKRRRSEVGQEVWAVEGHLSLGWVRQGCGLSVRVMS